MHRATIGHPWAAKRHLNNVLSSLLKAGAKEGHVGSINSKKSSACLMSQLISYYAEISHARENVLRYRDLCAKKRTKTIFTNIDKIVDKQKY